MSSGASAFKFSGGPQAHPCVGTSPCPQRGFTLIELMVVLMIIGVGTAAIGLAVTTDPAKGLRQDAQQLAQQLIVAQSEVRLDGRPIVWQADQNGYRFARATWHYARGSVVPVLSVQNTLDTFNRDDNLRARRWQSGDVHVAPQSSMVLGMEPIGTPWEIRLSRGDATVSVVRDAAGRYTVQ